MYILIDILDTIINMKNSGRSTNNDYQIPLKAQNVCIVTKEVGYIYISNSLHYKIVKTNLQIAQN